MKRVKVTTRLVHVVLCDGPKGYLAYDPPDWHLVPRADMASAHTFGRREAHERVRELRAEGHRATVVCWTRKVRPSV